MTFYVNPKMWQSHSFQPLSPLLFFEHGDSRGAAGNHTKFADYAYCCEMTYRPAGFGIQNMTIADSVNDDAAFVVTAAGDRTGEVIKCLELCPDGGDEKCLPAKDFHQHEGLSV